MRREREGRAHFNLVAPFFLPRLFWNGLRGVRKKRVTLLAPPRYLQDLTVTSLSSPCIWQIPFFFFFFAHTEFPLPNLVWTDCLKSLSDRVWMTEEENISFFVCVCVCVQIKFVLSSFWCLHARATGANPNDSFSLVILIMIIIKKRESQSSFRQSPVSQIVVAMWVIAGWKERPLIRPTTTTSQPSSRWERTYQGVRPTSFISTGKVHVWLFFFFFFSGPLSLIMWLDTGGRRQLRSPNQQQRTLNELPTELRRRNFVLISTDWACKSAPNVQKCVYAMSRYSDWASVLHTTVAGWVGLIIAVHFR